MTNQDKRSLQSVILTLQQYWADQGCVLWQPYHSEVGAGTMNPATTLRVLGPEPWWVAYVEPSIRPADGRYGKNPNRWQHYYQFQVILKPDPGDPQERYLQSLVALGIDPARHDIRFVEDNWESPALGAWGLGWEVWLDGQEITQYTYFQQSGGQTLDPVSVEITYGLERIVLALQGVDTFLDIQWNPALTYGEISLTAEREHSTYNFEVADVERLRVMYQEYLAESKSCLEHGLVFPAHDYILKCSHAFNLMDARGSVGVTERAAMFAQMRDLSRQVADAYLAQREEEGFPWKERWQINPPAKIETKEQPAPEQAADVLFEIGTEELPVDDLTTALEQLNQLVPAAMDQSRLGYKEFSVMGTPRRLLVHIKDVEPRQMDQESVEKGPPADRAFDPEGTPTQAAQGFARSKGVAVEDLEITEIDGGEYVVAKVYRQGLDADEVLGPLLADLVAALHFDRTMRWNQTEIAFSRPIRWLLALHGNHGIPVVYAGVTADRITRRMRFEEQEKIVVENAADYYHKMADSGILLEVEARRQEIKKQIEALAEEVGGQVIDDPDLLTEVANLVEQPTVLRGGFDESYLELPRPVLISVMKKHQRYFPVEKKGKLLPYFITVRNGGEEYLDVVRQGNEHVVHARFADARYFVQRDREMPLEAYLPRLATLTFQAKLGSMLDKVERIKELTAVLADKFDLDKSEAKLAIRTAELAKADLATQMVIEMTSLQGEIGRIYALEDGEPSEVALGIYEHYLPRSSGDTLPQSQIGTIVGLADRLDTLMGLFAAGLQPTGTRDPFALRRSAIGLVQIVIDQSLDFDLDWGLRQASLTLPLSVDEDTRQACLDFIRVRLEAQLQAEGFDHDVVQAVLEAQAQYPARAKQAVIDLSAWRQESDWMEQLQAFARCARITRELEQIGPVDPKLLQDKEAKNLYSAVYDAMEKDRQPGSVEDFKKVLIGLVPAITEFFDEVLVMADDPKVRTNRLNLVGSVVRLAEGVVDMSHLEGF
ncbi:MAG: glycine--tRNA ligase subunit beta [Anaerolineales bacterium]